MSLSENHFHLTPKNAKRLAILSGQFDEHFKQIEKFLHVTIQNHGHEFFITGENAQITMARQLIKQLYVETVNVEYRTPEHTRIGFSAKAVITGDITQTDLPPGKKSGLQHALIVLEKISHISRPFFDPKDVVRHPLVQAIIEAYEKQVE